MLRYIFLKLSGLSGKKEFSISSSCNQMLMFRPSTSAKKEFRREGRRIDQSKEQHKRSYSFPSRSRSSRFPDNESLCGGWANSEPSERLGLQPIRRKSFHQNSSTISKETSKRANSVKSEKSEFSTSLTKKKEEEKLDLRSKYHELGCPDSSERYELEVARPRRSKSELIFNVFDCVAKDVDLTDYLQPSNLKPFGSTDNIYLPLLMSQKNLDVISQSNPNYLQSVTDVDTPERDSSKNIFATRKTTGNQTNQINKVKKEFTQSKLYDIAKEKELNPVVRENQEVTVSKSSRDEPPASRSTESKPSNRSYDNEQTTFQSEASYESDRPVYTKSSVTIEPPPFLPKREDMFSSASFKDISKETKRNIANYKQVQPPWKAYSDHIKSLPKKTLVTYPTGTVMEDIDAVADNPQKPQRKLRLSRSHPVSMEKAKMTDDKPKAFKKHEMIKNNIPQRRTLSSMEHVRSSDEPSPSVEDMSKKAKSSTYAQKSPNKNSVTQSLVSLITKGVSLHPSQSYTKSSKAREFEPKHCKSPEKKKCFLPSKIRLKPPKCITKPTCPKPEPCPPRADDCIPVITKKLPTLKDGGCECFEPVIPNEYPKLKRLDMKFVDEPRVCPCVPVECPCPPPPRADDFAKPQAKKLVTYTPGECPCLEPPPMTDAPLVRLQKICVPEEKCYPKEPCVVETCEDKERADDCLEVCAKQLPSLKMGDCKCFEPRGPDINPKMRRLKLEFEDPPRVCPCVEPCVCPETTPVRSDECLEEKIKRLPIMKPKECSCIEPPPMIDVPLKRLKKNCIPEEVCYPKRECPEEKCEDKFRADMCLVEKTKKLPKFNPSDCDCFELHVPNQNPKVKRLRMKFVDEPRVCPCVPVECPCPPPLRADDFAPPKEKKLVPHVAKECACIEPPRMVDVPLVRLQKVCVPDEKCYPKEPCVVETCEDRQRADDCLREKPRKLRPIQPKPCPCIDYKMKEPPRLKRLSLSVPEPPRICPVKVCPPEEKCARADDCVPQKIKKLPTIKPGECPCVDQRMIDVKPLPRLKCKEDPEECLEEDPCVDFPRADWGCWEYTQDVEGIDDKCRKNKDLNYKQKRKFNTDSRNSINVNSARSRITNSINNKDIKSENVNRDLTGNDTDAKYINVKANLRRKSETPWHKRLQDRNVSTLPRDMKPNTSKTTTLVKPVKDNKEYLGKSVSLNRNNSFPTLFLLKELDQMEDTKKIKLKENKINKLGSILAKITPAPNHVNNCLLGSNVRNLSTVVTNTNKGTSFCPGTAQASSNSNKENKDCDEAKEKPCPSMSKCVQKPMILKNCPPKEDRTCEKLRPPVCCEKKQVPNPAFSECMDDEIQPFSNTSQWTCNRRQYGFEPNPKKANEPLDTVRSKKKFSTSATHNQNADNSVVNYFSIRYPKSEMQVSSSRGGQVFDRIIKSSCGCRNTQRDSSTLPDTTSDITECRSVKKNFASAEERHHKLLNQKSNYTVAGVSCRKMSTQDKGHALLRSDSFDLPYSRPNVSQSILRRDMSMLNNRYSNYTDGVTEDLTDDSLLLTQPSHRPYSSDKGNNQRSNCKFPKKKKKKKGYPKFKMDNCPAKERQTCTLEYPQRNCQRLPAPYPSFSELMDDEIEDKLTECPITKERVEELQPCYTKRFVTRKPLPPILPAQGRIDPKIEERCIREKLCMQNEGLTQDCENFGQYVKPLKSKHFFKERNRDCEKIEELKKLGKWPPKSMREFSTCVSTAFAHQKRNMCSSAHVGKIDRNEHQRESYRATENNIVLTNSKNASVRSFHALCKIPRNKATGKISKKTCQNRLMEANESSKYTGLRKVPRRIDNFQKWYKLKKMRYHTCSKLKYRRFVRRRRNTKPFTTCVAKTRVANLNVKGVICSKLKSKKIEKNRQNPKHLSISSAKTRIETNDSNQRSISTTNTLAKNNKPKLIRFPLYPKPVKKSTTLKIPNCPEKLKKIAHNVKNNEANVRSWQPKYPSVPEVDTVSIPSYQSKTESGWGKDCLIQLTGKEKNGKTWDCSAVEKPFIQLNSANLVDDCAKQDSMPCIPCGEVFMRSNNQVHMKATERRNQPAKCPKLPNSCEGEKKHSKRSMPSRLVCPSESKQPECKPSPCTPTVLNLWERIVNYFKAKPNCPAPDEWKKKALREKAEKAAKAAGLCLCEPEDLPQNVPERIIEKQSTNGSKINSNDDCFSTRKGPYRTTTRHYSSGVNSWDGEELEEEKKKQLAKKLSQVLLEEANYEDDVSQRCPDPLLESVFKEAIMHRNSLRCLEKSMDFESKDECVNYALNMIPSDINFLSDCIKEPSSEGTKFEQSQQISNMEEYFSAIDSMTEITFEELEQAKTKNLVKELDKLLKENQKSHKKN